MKHTFSPRLGMKTYALNTGTGQLCRFDSVETEPLLDRSRMEGRSSGSKLRVFAKYRRLLHYEKSLIKLRRVIFPTASLITKMTVLNMATYCRKGLGGGGVLGIEAVQQRDGHRKGSWESWSIRT